MEIIPPFSDGSIEALAKVLGDTNQGLTGSEISQLLKAAGIADIAPDLTKWKRLHAALARKQREKKRGDDVIAFIHTAMRPVRYVGSRETFDVRRAEVNLVLVFEGYELGEDGRISRVKAAATIKEAQARAQQLKSQLEARNVHPDVLKFCRAELLQENYFHAVLEATKSIASKIRDKSGLTTDGAELATAAFALGQGGTPILAINALSNETERGEQRGFVNLLIGLFGVFRNPTAHAEKLYWPIGEQDALDILGLASLVHRKIDLAHRLR